MMGRSFERLLEAAYKYADGHQNGIKKEEVDKLLGLAEKVLEDTSSKSVGQAQHFGERPAENQALRARWNVTGFEQGSVLSQYPLDPVEASV